DCPKGVRPIGTKWVLKNKKDERGIVIRNKDRLVAQGYTQEEWINYDEVFAPVARIEAIRLFLAYASFIGFRVYQMDVKSAFLYGTIDEEVYVMKLPRFQDPKFPAKVYKVEKAILFLAEKKRGDFILVQVYVDDIIFGSSNPQLCREFEALMHEKFQMSAMGELNFFLGLQVLQRRMACFSLKTNNLGKFEAKGDEGYFIGYSMSSKAFRVFNKRNKRVEENLHVEFLENKAIGKGAGLNWLFGIDSLTKSMNYVPVVAGINSTNLSGTKDAASQKVKKDVSSLRYIALPNWVHYVLLESSSSKPYDDCSTDVPESSGNSNPTATSTNPSADQMETLTTLVDCPKGVRPIGTKWVLKNKKDERGIVIRNKARLVAQGHTQEEWIDYDEVFAPVARIEAIRLFLAYASFMRFTVYQMDVKSAFLYGTINEEVYVMQPPRFQDPEFPTRVYKVKKAMYGLHQAPRAWYVYVDDIIFGSSNPQLCREFEALMHEKFQMSAMGELNFFLGLQVLQKEDGILFSQDKYVRDILKKFEYSDVRSANTPMDKENPWGKDGTGKDVDQHHYRSMIGSLMYLTTSRPYIMFAVCACARHQMTPKECHLHAVKRIFRYLKGHPKLGLWYPKESPFDLVAYSDSDYGGAIQDRKSTTGGCQFLGRRLISWQYKKQTIMATSTTEAKYVAAASCCGQVLWIQNQLLDYGYNFIMKSLNRNLNVTNILSAGQLTTPQMVLNSPCLTHIKN
nr:hypothetical protein [Tanacetum cinerariifolium]